MEFTAFRSPLVPVSSFKYLGGVLLSLDDYWTVVLRNLIRLRKKWARLTRVLGREGAYTCTLGMFYVAVVQVVLIYA